MGHGIRKHCISEVLHKSVSLEAALVLVHQHSGPQKRVSGSALVLMHQYCGRRKSENLIMPPKAWLQHPS